MEMKLTLEEIKAKHKNDIIYRVSNGNADESQDAFYVFNNGIGVACYDTTVCEGIYEPIPCGVGYAQEETLGRLRVRCVRVNKIQ